MLYDEELSKVHEKYKYKFYTFKSFYPIEKDKLYKKGKVYLFTIRSISEEFSGRIEKCLIELKDDEIEVLSVQKKELNYKGQLEFKTITPVFITIDGKPWKPQENGLEVFIERIQNNLLKKYRDIYSLEPLINGYFIERFSIDEKPCALKYKNIKLIGYKVKFKIYDDEESKKLACIALGAGLGEKNSSIGGGYCEVV